MLDYLTDEVGIAASGGMGAVPITHLELRAWQQNMQRFLQPWELDFMHRLSIAYCAEAADAQASDAPAPWQEEIVTDAELRNVAERLRHSMRKGSAK